VQIFKYSKVVHSTAVHSEWPGKPNPTVPKGNEL